MLVTMFVSEAQRLITLANAEPHIPTSLALKQRALTSLANAKCCQKVRLSVLNEIVKIEHGLKWEMGL
jgi:hypothetical protein